MLKILEKSDSPRPGVFDDEWAELFQLIQPPVLTVLKRFHAIAGQEDQDDMLQEVMLRVHQHRLKYDPSRPFLPWVYQIARNVKLDWINEISLATVDLPLDPQAPDKTTAVLITGNLLAKLSQQDQQILRLSYYEGLSNAEISKKLNIKLSATKGRLRRAINRARKVLNEEPST